MSSADFHLKVEQQKDIYNEKEIKKTILFNAIEDGWRIEKQGKNYIFSKKHLGKSEFIEESYLSTFLKEYIIK